MKRAISAVNLVLCFIGPATAGPCDDAVGIFQPVAGQRHPRVDCLSSASAVWAAHPGSHAAWRLPLKGHEGEKCWFTASRSKAHADASRDTGHEIGSMVATAVPLPRSRSQNTLSATERRPSSVQLSGSPMRIDSRWEEIFTRRERGAE
jgi:hypothetical protein